MAANTQKLNAKSVAKYMILPGILPRVQELVGGGFGYLAFLFASVYGAVRILPPGHPFLKYENVGKFTILQVIRAAANNVEMNRRNLDQIIVFFALLAAVVILFLQFILLLLGLFSGKAFAQPADGGAPFESMFVTPFPGTDIAFLMLDYVFGIPGTGGGTSTFFGSNALAASGGPTAFHQGLHALFNFYNLAILLVAVLIFLYYVFVVVMETAQTGVPFGKRFSKLYAPFRLILAVGLLVPLNYGFNGAQYITLYAAKMGSSFATNGWVLYNEALQNPMGAKNSSLIARPRTPSIDELLYFSSVYHACREIYKLWGPKDTMDPSKGGIEIDAYVIVDNKPVKFSELSYLLAIGKFGNQDIEVVLGEDDEEAHKAYAGHVRPYCGKMVVSLSNENPPVYNTTTTPGADLTQGILAVEQMWYIVAQEILKPEGVFSAFGERAAHHFLTNENVHDSCYKSGEIGDGSTCNKPNWWPPGEAFASTLYKHRMDNSKSIMDAYEQFRNNLNLQLPEELRRRGWGGAGIWYNQIADLNGTFSSAIYATPTIKNFPEVMEYVRNQRQVQDNQAGMCESFNPNLADHKQVEFKAAYERLIAVTLHAAYEYHVCKRVNQETSESSGTGPSTPSQGTCKDIDLSAGAADKGMTTNTFINVVGLIFGINGLFDIRCNSQIDEATGMSVVHPLAQLSTVGKSLVENAIRSMAMAVGAAFGGGMLGVLTQTQALGQALQAASGMFVGIATIGLSTGFILYYILPFLPFMYFFFAVGSWVKSIFEAMVGVPLWALAHLKIDGDGLPGKAALGGYFLIFEIALRPIFIVFGLIAGMAVFGAMAVALNNLFDLVVINITGATPDANTGSTMVTGSVESLRRGVIDQFFFTIMYAVLLYLMATSSFKMIDTIPQSVMRWIGSSVPTFNDNKQDPTAGLTQYAAMGGAKIGGDVMGAIAGGAGTAGRAAGGLANELINPKPEAGG